MTKYFVDTIGRYIGGFDGAESPEGAIEVPIAPDDARQIWNGTSWLLTLDDACAAKLAVLAAKRWAVESGGIIIGGASVDTDAVSQAKITGAVSLFEKDGSLQSIDWKTQSGAWASISAAAMTAIGVEVGRHVQACFSREKALAALILAASDHAALDAVDIEAGWPAGSNT